MIQSYLSRASRFLAVGFGIAIFNAIAVAALALAYRTSENPREEAPYRLVIALISATGVLVLVGSVLLVTGFCYLAMAKRRSAAWGFASLLGPPGWALLFFLPSAHLATRAVTEEAVSDDAILTTLGMSTDDGMLRAACAQIARRIHAESIRVIGFVPAHEDVAVPPVIIQLGLSLTELTGATVAVVDANVRYPGLAALNRGQATDGEGTVFSTRWLRGSLALLSPPRVEQAGEVVPQLARVLLDGSDLFAHVLVDLTGFELLGEHGSAAACMDGVALVARAHHTREADLLELAPSVPQSRFLGVLLVG